MSDHETWANQIASDAVDDQVNALRQISGRESVTGLTVTIVELSGSSNDEVRMWAAEALESSVQPDVSEVRGLTGLLRQAQDGEICYWSATMLGRLGKQSVGAVDVLEACVRESMYLPARERATWALCQIGPQAVAAVETLEEAAAGAPPRLQRLATEALEAIRDKAA